MPDAVQNETVERIRRLVDLAGDERVLVVGEPLAELEPHVGELATAATDQVTTLPFERGAFDLTVTIGTLHHVRRPELAVAELVRVTRLGGRLLVADRLASVDPLQAIELDRLERERDPAHTRLLPDADMRGFFDANGLVLLRSDVQDGTGWYVLRR
ncbi:MAG: methyltransferase domain-containing protein [Gaiellaceae bacterium]